ncbi:hypothetical protein MUK42_37765 [Musa troglodytarum]|uniref:Uncharacterized protein n=1 Tax=Musa troglodytarum TaxID=320322 RepID=A0A9E7F3R2_9LILI|nr:hypothetical protein MUK42_37765 [Musa troglodytarum]
MTVIAETRNETAGLSKASSLLCLSRPRSASRSTEGPYSFAGGVLAPVHRGILCEWTTRSPRTSPTRSLSRSGMTSSRRLSMRWGCLVDGRGQRITVARSGKEGCCCWQERELLVEQLGNSCAGVNMNSMIEGRERPLFVAGGNKAFMCIKHDWKQKHYHSYECCEIVDGSAECKVRGTSSSSSQIGGGLFLCSGRSAQTKGAARKSKPPDGRALSVVLQHRERAGEGKGESSDANTVCIYTLTSLVPFL